MHSIRIEELSFAYAGQEVLQQINFSAEAGDFVCLLGPSGCGKSTLLRLLAGLNAPSCGQITVDGVPIQGPGLDRGVVFQDYSLFPWLTAGENIVFALEQSLPGRKKAEYQAIARTHLRQVQLEAAYDKLPAQLSGGMRQRAAIARVFAMNTPILLMDEPFGALDAVTRVHLQDVLLQLWQQPESGNKTVFFVTHDVEEAILLANTIVVLGANPGTIKKQFRVDLERPRVRRALYATAAFQTLRDALVAELYEETAL